MPIFWAQLFIYMGPLLSHVGPIGPIGPVWGLRSCYISAPHTEDVSALHTQQLRGVATAQSVVLQQQESRKTAKIGRSPNVSPRALSG